MRLGVIAEEISLESGRNFEKVNRANTRGKKAWDLSLWSRENELRRATSRLRDTTKIIRKLLIH